MAFPPLGNSDHVVVKVFIGFPSYSQRSAPIWDGLRDNLRDVPWKDIFKRSAFAAASEFCEWFRLELMYISVIESIRSSLTNLHDFQLLVLLP